MSGVWLRTTSARSEQWVRQCDVGSFAHQVEVEPAASADQPAQAKQPDRVLRGSLAAEIWERPTRATLRAPLRLLAGAGTLQRNRGVPGRGRPALDDSTREIDAHDKQLEKVIELDPDDVGERMAAASGDLSRCGPEGS